MKSIIMRPESVTRILHGLKTQTRRLVKVPDSGDFYRFDGFAAVFTCGTCVYPRFAPGDVCFCKEPYAFAEPAPRGRVKVVYKDDLNLTATYKWRTPLFMPEWASRAKVRITGVRCERLQAIDEAGARAEGCVRDRYREPSQGVNETGRIVVSARDVFAREWDKINPKAPFASNPLVWVYTFEVHREAT